MILSDVAAIIVNFRTPQRTATLARRLVRQGLREVVVVDNSSPDGAVISQLCAMTGVRLVTPGRNIGYGAACNFGARNTTCPLLLFLNSDAEPIDDAIARLAVAFDDTTVEIAAPRLITPGGANQRGAVGAAPGASTILRRTNRRRHFTDPIDWVTGAALAIRRTSFERVGGFDEGFHMYFEDVDLCRRIGREAIRVVPEAVVVHQGGASRTSSVSRQGQYARSQWRFLTIAGEPGVTRVITWLGTWVMFLLRAAARRFEPFLRRLLGATRERTTTSLLFRRPTPRVNLGCGDHPVSGWINVDVALNDQVRPDVVADLHRLPFRPASLRSVYCGHVLEHLPYEEAVEAIAETGRLLAAEGSILAVGPDVTRAASMVEEGTMTEAEFDLARHGAGRWPGDEHHWACDEAALIGLFIRAGYEAEPVNVATIRGWPLSSRALWQCAVRAWT